MNRYTQLWVAFYDAQRQTSNQKTDQWIHNLSSCANEIFILIRLLFWELNVGGFEDRETDYWGVLVQKLQAIWKFLKDCSVEEIQQILWSFAIKLSGEDIAFKAEEIKNLLDQRRI